MSMILIDLKIAGEHCRMEKIGGTSTCIGIMKCNAAQAGSFNYDNILDIDILAG